MELKQAYARCEAVAAHHSKTFYRAFSLLPLHDRRAIWAIYAFCRRVDDIVDEGAHPKEQLQQFEAEWKSFLAGDEHDDFMWVALRDVFSRYEMDVEPFWHMIEGQTMDLTVHRYETFSQLLRYCYCVASTVGLMLLPILAPNHRNELKESAIALGEAMQLTNILRDVGEDMERGRIYLPREWMKLYGVSEQQLAYGEVTNAFIHLWEQIAEEAEKRYALAGQTFSLYPLSARLAVKGAATMYRSILQVVREQRYDVFTKRAFVSAERKQVLLQQIGGESVEVG
ncbi:phytoene/squalene synthase family protein [Anoxybacillus flavithermus]|uniref:Phytoene synthase n=1 Tax=Anoxybacillus flavithermus AK1 TaxID=1297581 RepID=M8D780_9BACL|nr:phytoene/squalene synthase family protein [Anoxybacillus flavithermus]EMT46732.1 phytoene synthase [Anoxybacillus flavithermus AK1]